MRLETSILFDRNGFVQWILRALVLGGGDYTTPKSKAIYTWYIEAVNIANGENRYIPSPPFTFERFVVPGDLFTPGQNLGGLVVDEFLTRIDKKDFYGFCSS